MPSRWRRRWPVDWRACWVPAAAAETAAHADSDRWGGTGRAPRRCSVELALPLPPSLPSSLPPPPLLLPPRLSQPPPTAAGWGATCTRTPHGPVRACSLALSLCALLCALLSPVATLSALPVVISSVAVALRFIPQTFPPPPPLLGLPRRTALAPFPGLFFPQHAPEKEDLYGDSDFETEEDGEQGACPSRGCPHTRCTR